MVTSSSDPMNSWLEISIFFLVWVNEMNLWDKQTVWYCYMSLLNPKKTRIFTENYWTNGQVKVKLAQGAFMRQFLDILFAIGTTGGVPFWCNSIFIPWSALLKDAS